MTEKRELTLAELAEGGIKARGESSVPRDYLVEAVSRIEAGLEKNVIRYPTGVPTLISIAKVGRRLYTEATR